MAFVPLEIPPGVFRNGTKYEARGRWFDTNLVRWAEGAMQPVGGWQKVTAGGDDINLSDEVFLDLPGESGDYASTPDAAALDITGDIDLRVEAALDDWSPTGFMALVAKWTASGDQRSYQLRITTAGEIELVWSTDGTLANVVSENSTVGLGGVVSNGGRIWVRATLDVDNGASGYDVTFYHSTDGSTWTQLGAVVTGGATTSIHAGTAIVEVGSVNVGTATLADGGVYNAQILSGIDGTTELDANFQDQLVGATSFTEASANAATVTINQSGDPQAEIVADNGANSADTPVLGMLGWRDNDGDAWLALGTPCRCWAFSEGVITEITPSGFTCGQASATSATGTYGSGGYGVGPYGEGDPSQATITEAQSWQLDNFGQLLVAVAHSDGVLYSWDLNTANDLTEVDPSAPTDNIGVVVTPERFVVALGAGGDPRKIQWADQESLTVWAATAENQAGDFTLPGTGGIMAGARGRNETLIWTTQDLFSMKFIGGTLVYSIPQVGSNCGLISRRAMTVVDGGRALWMGHRSFFVYDGIVRPIPSEVSDFVFSDINRLQSSKIHAVPRTEFNEVEWHYCSAGSSEIDRRVVYNYAEGHWRIGSEPGRTAGIDRGVFSYPMLADRQGFVYDHERGTSYLDLDGSAVTPFAESGPFEIGDGDRTMAVLQIVPDERTLGDVQASIFTALYPTATETENGPFTLANPTSVRLSARQVRLKVEQVRSGWRVGVVRLDVVPMGRR